MHFQQHSVYFYVQYNCVSNTIEMCDNPRLTAFYNPYSIFMQTIVIYKMFCIKSLRFYFLSQIFGTQYLYYTYIHNLGKRYGNIFIKFGDKPCIGSWRTLS